MQPGIRVLNQQTSHRPRIVRVLRIASGLILLALLAYSVDWQALPRHFARLSWQGTLLATAALGASFIISPWKWQVALAIHDLHFELRYLIARNGVGFFLNNFLPSAIGGDAYRVISTWPQTGYRSRAVSAVVIERIVGFGALLAIGNLGALALSAHSAIARLFMALTALGAVVGTALLLAAHAGGLNVFRQRFSHLGFIDAIRHNVQYLRHAGSKWFALVAISLLFQAIAIANIYILFRSLGTPLPWAICAMLGAVAGLAAVIPLSINGLGVVEGSFAGTAVALGVDYEAALAVAVLIRLLVLPASLVFGLLYALDGGSWQREQSVSSRRSTDTALH